MGDLSINRSSRAQRCDICHHSDQFDPIKEICNRCAPFKSRAIADDLPAPARVALDIKLKFVDFIRASFERVFKSFFGWLLIGFGIGWSIVVLIDIGPGAFYSHEPVLLLIAPILILFPGSLIPMLLVLLSIHNYFQLRRVDNRYRIVFDDKGVSAITRFSTVHYAWKSLTMAYETRNTLQLNFRQISYLIPKQTIVSTSDRDYISTQLSSHLGKKARLIKDLTQFNRKILAAKMIVAVGLLCCFSFTIKDSYRQFQFYKISNLQSQAYKLASSKDYRAAETAYRQVMQLEKAHNYYTFKKLAYCQLKLHEFDDAEASYRYGLSLNGSYGSPNYQRLPGIIAAARKDYQRAETLFAQAMNCNVSNIGLRYDLARVYFLRSNYQDARKQFQFVIDIAPDTEWGNKASAFMDYMDGGNANIDGLVLEEWGQDYSINSYN